MKNLTNIQLAGLYDALLTAEEDGTHNNPEHEHQMSKLQLDIEVEIQARGFALITFTHEYSPYSQASWEPH